MSSLPTPSTVPPIAVVETDRFCEYCGYNLRTQAVYRDEHTQLLLVRCPECGRLQPAADATTVGRLWRHRLALFGLFVWVVLTIVACFGLSAGQFGVSYGTLEELTTYAPTQTATTSQPASAPAVPAAPTITINRGGVTTIRQIGATTTWRREVRAPDGYDTAFRLLTRSLSFLLGFLLIALITVVMHHWPRWCYFLPAVLISVAVAVLVWSVWRAEYPHLSAWAVPLVIFSATVHLAGGITGALLGRPSARLLATIILPPRLRQTLAFLWFVDGKALPSLSNP